MPTPHDQLVAILQKTYPAETGKIVAGATFQEAGFDSLKVVEFLLVLQRELDIPLAGDELPRDSTLADAVEMVKSAAANG